jgi:hypothetical protein
VEVGNVLEQLRPVAAHLIDSPERTGGVHRLLASVILVEAGEHALQIVRVLRSRQALDYGPWVIYIHCRRRLAA